MPATESISKIRADFLRTIEKKNPLAYNLALATMAKKELGLSGLGFTRNPVTGLYGLGAVDVTVGTTDTAAQVASDPTVFDKFLSTLKEMVPAYANYQLTRDLYSLNMERAKQGLPPIDAAAVSPQVNVGLAPQTQQLLVVGGLGLLAVLLLTRGKKHA